MAVYSQKLIDKCKKHQLHVEDYVFCLLSNADFSVRDAYVAAYHPATNNPTALSTQATKKQKDESIKRYINLLAEEKRREETFIIEQEKKLRAEIMRELQQSGQVSLPSEPVADADGQPTQSGQLYTAPQKRTKEDIIREINIKLDSCRDDKEWRELQKMLIDVENMKKDTDEAEEDTIHYYFPVSCSDCSHNPDNKKNSPK